jgi:hypothetical protein
MKLLEEMRKSLTTP